VENKPIFCLMGPTASGKTDLACLLSLCFPFEIVSVDSAMIYREMNIGSAKPEAETLTRFPHHLIDCVNPTDYYSAAQFCTDARTLCQSIQARGRIPLLVGGSMMYFNALQQGLSPLPESSSIIRQQLVSQTEAQGLASLYQRLQAIDPETAARLHAHDTQRIQRALEVYLITHTPMSELLRQAPTKTQERYINLALIPKDRSWLHQRIHTRFEQMLKIGFIDEVRTLKEKWQLTSEHPAMRAVGYRQVFAYLDHAYDDTTLHDKGIAATRQLAKRQLTWIKNGFDCITYDAEANTLPEQLKKTIAEHLSKR